MESSPVKCSQDPAALFINAAREIAIACSLEPTARRKAGLVLELSRSQAGARWPVHRSKPVRPVVRLPGAGADGIEEHVRMAAGSAPVSTWWRSRAAQSRPRELCDGDVWISAEDIQRLADRYAQKA